MERENTVYTPEQIRWAAELAYSVMLATVTSDPTGPVSTVREMVAGGQYVAEAFKRYPNNYLIVSVAGIRLVTNAEAEAPDAVFIDVDMNNTAAAHEALTSYIETAAGQIGDEGELAEYKRFLVELAEHVAQAAGSGVFGTGAKVTAQEAAFIGRLRGMLGVA
jgi:hypothetical protein